jgi:hypothetical protein
MLPKDETKSAAGRRQSVSDKEAKAATETTPGNGAKGAARTSPTKSAAAKSAGTRSTASGPTARTAAQKSGGAADDLEQRIQQRAYELWENEGRPAGREHAHWQQAEREITGRGAGDRA